MAVSTLGQRGRSLPCGPLGGILCQLRTRDSWRRRWATVIIGPGAWSPAWSHAVSPWGAVRELGKCVGGGVRPIDACSLATVVPD